MRSWWRTARIITTRASEKGGAKARSVSCAYYALHALYACWSGPADGSICSTTILVYITAPHDRRKEGEKGLTPSIAPFSRPAACASPPPSLPFYNCSHHPPSRTYRPLSSIRIPIATLIYRQRPELEHAPLYPSCLRTRCRSEHSSDRASALASGFRPPSFPLSLPPSFALSEPIWGQRATDGRTDGWRWPLL